MLVKALVGCLALPAAVLMAAPAAPRSAAIETKATGSGSIVFGKDGVAMFNFSVFAEPTPRGSMLCAAEHHDEYPETVVNLDSVHRTSFREHAVSFTGRGTLGDQPVTIKVVAIDGVGSGYPDHFSVVCVSTSGSVAFEAEGDLTLGDIYVGDPH